MAASPLLPSSTLVLLFFLLHSSTITTLSRPTTIGHIGGGFSVKLIHRDSPGSPYYNASATPFDRVRAAAHRSVARLTATATTSSFQSKMIPNGFVEHLMTLTLGTPPTNVLLAADTGSSLLWTQCLPCTDCYPQRDPIFNPYSSSTYKKQSCDSDSCKHIKSTCSSDADKLCLYDIRYGDKSFSQGVLSSETFIFDSAGDGQGSVSIPNLIFGCSHTSKGAYSNTDGLVGLGREPESLISQLSSTIGGKFSYCLVPFMQSSAASVLSFGDRAVVSGSGVVSTPLVTGGDYDYLYGITLEAIVIGGGGQGGEKIAVNSKIGGGGSSGGHVVVDTGTTLTFLDGGVVNELEKKISSIIKLRPAEPRGEYRKCFEFDTVKQSSCDLPDITFHFTGAAVRLGPFNSFMLVDKSVVCLAIVPIVDNTIGFAVFGNLAQQNYHIGIDLQAQMHSFAPADCSKL